MSDLLDYRRDLAILDPAGGRSSRAQQSNPTRSSLGQIAPWITGSSSTASAPAADPIPTTFYNDSTDNLSLNSQLSPGLRTSISRATPAGSTESPDAAYFTDERRPSIASIATTASSQGSRASGPRGGIRKLQGFFGEEFPGRDSSEISLAHPGAGKEHRSHSYSYNRPHRDRNYSNATDHGRDGSPSSRPRTPVPAPEVVPFLYQEADVRAMTPQPTLAPKLYPSPFLLWAFCPVNYPMLPCLQPFAHGFLSPRPKHHAPSDSERDHLGHCAIRGSARPRLP